jgi:hypothetical protein
MGAHPYKYIVGSTVIQPPAHGPGRFTQLKELLYRVWESPLTR